MLHDDFYLFITQNKSWHAVNMSNWVTSLIEFFIRLFKHLQVRFIRVLKVQHRLQYIFTKPAPRPIQYISCNVRQLSVVPSSSPGSKVSRGFITNAVLTNISCKSDVQKWHPKGASKSNVQKGCIKVMSKSDIKKWHPKVRSKSYVQKWRPKVTSKSGMQNWGLKVTSKIMANIDIQK